MSDSCYSRSHSSWQMPNIAEITEMGLCRSRDLIPIISSSPNRLILVQVFKLELEFPQEPDRLQVQIIAMDSTIEVNHSMHQSR
jgi:hypothetical protein